MEPMEAQQPSWQMIDQQDRFGTKVTLFRLNPEADDNPIPSHYRLRTDPPIKGPYSYMSAEPLQYQNGPVKERGVNGWQHREVILTILDRLNVAQEGPFACQENAEQIRCLHEFLELDDARTARRLAAGTEGTNTGK